MAAITTSNEFILLTNGADVGIVEFSSPGEFRCVSVPSIPAASRGDPTQACLPRRKAATDAGEHAAEGAGEEDGVVPPTADGKEVGGGKNSRSEHAPFNYTRAFAISHCGSYVAICDDRKYLHVYQVKSGGDCSILSSRCTARRCTSICFSPDDSLVLVADKSGDVYSFPTLGQGQGHIHRYGQGSGGEQEQDGDSKDRQENDAGQRGEERVAAGAGEDGPKEEAVEEEEEEGGASEGKLVLGHLSMLLDVLLVDSGQLVVTCDRDEKIRISSFPDAYNIQAYCLGHTEFVIRLVYDDANKVLLSASGDCTIRAWNLDGKEICSRNILDDLPQESTNGNADGVSPEQTIEPHRPAITQTAYCATCGLLFVAMDKSPHILVYRLQVSSASCGQGSFTYVTILGHGQEETEGAADKEKEAPAPVFSLSVQASVLWVLRQSPGSKSLQVTAHTICLRQDNQVKIVEVARGSKESQVVETISKQTDFLTGWTPAEELLPFLWKSSFQDDFKLRCNLKRESPGGEQGEMRKGRWGKKAKGGGGGGGGHSAITVSTKS